MTIESYDIAHLSPESLTECGEPFTPALAGWYLTPPHRGEVGPSDLYSVESGRPVLQLGIRGPFVSEDEARSQRDRLRAIDSGGASES